jgi:hypothetical protein
MNIKEWWFNMKILFFCFLMFLVYVFFVMILSNSRKNTYILIDFDSVLVDISHIIRRSEIYLKNNPDKNQGEYIGAHISEQLINSRGVSKVLALREKGYKFIFVSNRDESLRIETASVLNEWGLKGQLFMQKAELGIDRSLHKCFVINSLLKSKFKISKILDWSSDHIILCNNFPNIKTI